MKTVHLTLITIAIATLITGCGGGGGDETTSTESSATNTTSTPTPTGCTPAPIAPTGYSLVFKGCSVAGAAEYYDKTECIRDNVSGLIWEGKPASGSRANTNVYTNFDDPTKAQKGVLFSPSQGEIDANSNSVGFKNSVNNQMLCGFNNWRMPLKIELQGIQQSNGKVDANWFPNTVSGFYWSMSLTPSLPENLAIVVNFNNGGFGDFGRELPQAVRLVRQ